MSQNLPKLLFVGAGNIAQSIIKGIIKTKPEAKSNIFATALTSKNLTSVYYDLGCKTAVIDRAIASLKDFEPEFVFLCVKPQVIIENLSQSNSHLNELLIWLAARNCTTLSLMAGIKSDLFVKSYGMDKQDLVRVMLNTAAEIGSTSVLYHAQASVCLEKIERLENLFKLIGQSVIRLNDESLMDVGTGLCGSGIAFYYEIIQAISDIGVKNGMNRADATSVAAQLSKAAGEMILTKQAHPYKLRDDVTSPAGTTIFGLSQWHEDGTSQRIGRAFQASIDRAKTLSSSIRDRIDNK